MCSLILAVSVRWTPSNCFMSSIFAGCHSGQQYSSRDRTNVWYRGMRVAALRSKNTERIQERIFLAPSVMLVIWWDQEMSFVIVTPRSFTFAWGLISEPSAVTYSLNCCWNGNSNRWFLLLAGGHISSNLFSWRSILFSSDHFIELARSDWSNSTSWVVLIAFFSRVSSAKLEMTECFIQDCRSFRYSMNKIGPRTVPWGTPEMTFAGYEWLPSITTVCCLLER